ncbi:MAG: hypothetical protein WCO44_06695 [Bacteroidota bacterium]
MENLKKLWLSYNETSNKLGKALGRTSNIVGEYAEYIALRYYGGSFLKISDSGADIRDKEGRLFQVKARKMEVARSTQLGIIRSWEFDYLVVILFDPEGRIIKALEVPVTVAKEYGVANKHQNGWVITTNREFLQDARSKDISAALSKINQ